MKAERRYELAEKKYGVKPTPEMLCPRWDKCNVNCCVLNKDYDKLVNTPGDKYKCKCPKLIRKQIGVYFNLKNKGLTEREIAGAKRWANLTPEQKKERTRELVKNSPFVRLKSKGYGIVRVGKQNQLLTHTTDAEPPKNTTTEINTHHKAPATAGADSQSKLNEVENESN